MNELRAQAQARINQGVIDIHEPSSSLLHKIQNVPHTLTTVDEDFNKRKASGLKLNLSVTPAIYVVKKWPSILDRLVDWFEDASGDSVLTKPLLLIDDEADYASINTLHNKSDFTRTNQTIRNLLGKFERSTYVAYTATPFANVFIPHRANSRRPLPAAGIGLAGATSVRMPGIPRGMGSGPGCK